MRAVLAAMTVLGVAVLDGCVVATSSRNNGGSGGLAFLLLPLAFAAAAFAMARGGRRRRARRANADEGDAGGVNPQLIRAELSVLADDVVRLEPRVVLTDAARDDFDAATHRYRVAQAALDYTDAPVDLIRVQRVVDEASYSMSRVRAILEHRPPPEPPVSLGRPGSSGEPAIVLDDGARPVYDGSAASFRSGWFGGGGGLIGGLLLGSMMGGFGGWIADEGGEEIDRDGETSDW